MTGIRILPAAPRHRAAWDGLYAGYAAFYRVAQTPAMRDTVWGWIMDPAHEVKAFLAEDAAGRALGLAHYRPFARPLAAGVGGYLDDLFVAPEARGMQVAPEARGMQVAPEARGMQVSPEARGMQVSPEARAMQVSPEARGMQVSPEARGMQVSPEARGMQVSPEARGMQVSPEARGQRIADALIEAVAEEGRRRGWGVIRWITADDNYRGRGVYDRLATRTMWITYERKLG